MKPITLKSVYGKTIKFENDGLQSGRIQATVRDAQGEFVRNLLFTTAEIAKLTEALAGTKSDEGVFFLLRQKKTKDTKIKVCWADSPISKEYTNRSKAEAAAARLNENYPEWDYFVVEKEAK